MGWFQIFPKFRFLSDPKSPQIPIPSVILNTQKDVPNYLLSLLLKDIVWAPKRCDQFGSKNNIRMIGDHPQNKNTICAQIFVQKTVHLLLIFWKTF